MNRPIRLLCIEPIPTAPNRAANSQTLAEPPGDKTYLAADLRFSCVREALEFFGRFQNAEDFIKDVRGYFASGDPRRLQWGPETASFTQRVYIFYVNEDGTFGNNVDLSTPLANLVRGLTDMCSSAQDLDDLYGEVEEFLARQQSPADVEWLYHWSPEELIYRLWCSHSALVDVSRWNDIERNVQQAIGTDCVDHSLLGMLAEFPDEITQTLVAANAYTPVTVLKTLTKSDSRRVRAALAENPSLPDDWRTGIALTL